MISGSLASVSSTLTMLCLLLMVKVRYFLVLSTKSMQIQKKWLVLFTCSTSMGRMDDVGSTSSASRPMSSMTSFPSSSSSTTSASLSPGSSLHAARAAETQWRFSKSVSSSFGGSTQSMLYSRSGTDSMVAALGRAGPPAWPRAGRSGLDASGGGFGLPARRSLRLDFGPDYDCPRHRNCAAQRSAACGGRWWLPKGFAQP
mmetsp:Transcript_20312/g.61658  ORF Transcript_20312/g.61658 Transcript_20312/m.61658 type:complete len:201 (-) Transcript_20312:12-614(-)